MEEQQHERILRVNLPTLEQKIDTEGQLFSILYSRGALTKPQFHTVRSKKTSLHKAGALIAYFMEKPKNQFEILKEALIQDGQEGIVDYYLTEREEDESESEGSQRAASKHEASVFQTVLEKQGEMMQQMMQQFAIAEEERKKTQMLQEELRKLRTKLEQVESEEKKQPSQQGKEDKEIQQIKEEMRNLTVKLASADEKSKLSQRETEGLKEELKSLKTRQEHVVSAEKKTAIEKQVPQQRVMPLTVQQTPGPKTTGAAPLALSSAAAAPESVSSGSELTSIASRVQAFEGMGAKPKVSAKPKPAVRTKGAVTKGVNKPPAAAPWTARKDTTDMGPERQEGPCKTSTELQLGVSVDGQVGQGLYVMGGKTDNDDTVTEVTMSRVEGDGQISPFTVASHMPEGRHSAGVAVVRGVVYVAGGRDDGNECHSTLWRYSPPDNTWQHLPPMSTPRSLFPLLAVADCVVAVGGVTTVDGKPQLLSSCEMYDVHRGQWTEVTSLPAPVFAHSGCVASDGNMYISGGACYSGMSPHVLVYDGEGTEWQDRPLLLQARMSHVMVSWRDNLLVSGGHALIDGHRVNILTTEMFDMCTQQWSELTSPLTQGRLLSGGVMCGDRVYIVGGVSWNSDGTVSRHNTVVSRDLSQPGSIWSTLSTTLPSPVVSLMVCLVPLDSHT